MNFRTASASRLCSSVNSKSMSAPQRPENRLGDEVSLDLVRAAVDGRLAEVEVARPQGSGVRRPDEACPSILAPGVPDVRGGVGSGGQQEQLGDRLLDLRSFDLQDRCDGPEVASRSIARGAAR